MMIRLIGSELSARFGTHSFGPLTIQTIVNVCLTSNQFLTSNQSRFKKCYILLLASPGKQTNTGNCSGHVSYIRRKYVFCHVNIGPAVWNSQ